MTRLNANSLRVLPLKAPVIVIPITLDFSVDTDYALDLKVLTDAKKINCVQSLYLDLADCGQPISVTDPDSTQRITARGNSQGFYCLLSSNPAHLNFHCVGGSLVYVYLINVPAANSQWATI